MRNQYGIPVPSRPFIDFVHGWAAGWLAFGPVMVASVLRSWGWV